MPLIYIGVGSNMGKPERNIDSAINALRNILDNFRVSSIYKTSPRDYFEQDYFLNVVVSGYSDLDPLDLLDQLQQIERDGGRKRIKSIPKGPRTIDLDLLHYGQSIIDLPRLTVPHPSIKMRKFVLIPLLELDSHLKDPKSGSFYFKDLEKIEDQGVYCSSLRNYNNSFL